MNSFQETKQMMESFLKREHLTNDRYNIQNIYYANQSPKKQKKQEIYRVSGSQHMFLERVYKKEHVCLQDFAILKSGSFFVYRGFCSATRANFGVHCLLEFLKQFGEPFKFVSYDVFHDLVTLSEEKGADAQGKLVDAFPQLYSEVNNSIQLLCDSDISRKQCVNNINIIYYRTDAYVLSKLGADMLTELKITNLLRKTIQFKKIYYEYEGKESVVFKTYFSDYYDWKRDLKTMHFDISSFLFTDFNVAESNLFYNESSVIERKYIWLNKKFEIINSNWLYDDEIYFITMANDLATNKSMHSQLYPFNSVILCNNPSKSKIMAEYVEVEYKLKAKIMDIKNNLDFLIKRKIFYVQKSKRPTSIFMIYALNGIRIKEVRKESISNLNTYVYIFHSDYYIWKGNASSNEELQTAIAFVESKTLIYFLVDTEQFKELIHKKHITTYSVPEKTASSYVRIYGFTENVISKVDTVDIYNKTFTAFFVDFQSFIVIIKTEDVDKKIFIKYAMLYAELERHYGIINKQKKNIFFLTNNDESAFMSYFTEPKKKCCIKMFAKQDKLICMK